jgi:uncharacterized protein (TIGR00661 family)
MERLKFMFIVQGEGRGHMTQAISTFNILTKAGHEISCVMIGINPHREIPEFVKHQIKSEIISFDCPGFIMDAQIKAVKLIPSIIHNIFKLGVFRKSILHIQRKVKEHKPDLIVNFYTPLAGIYNFLFHRPVPMVCVAHQYIYLHPGYEFPEGRFLDRFAIRFYTKLTSLGAKKRLALSFYPINNNLKHAIIGFPPLLRTEVFEQDIKEGNYLLVYLVNSGYAEEIINWHKKNTAIELHCFTDNKDLKNNPDANLYFHKLDDKKFLTMMAQCKGLISTAGFESVCEAKYMGKPVFMVPVEGNYEQYCNAHDACKTGAGICDNKFNIGKFLTYLPSHKQNRKVFKQWADSVAEKLLEELMV